MEAIVDGRALDLPYDVGSDVWDMVLSAPDGNCLVALNRCGDVLVRWVATDFIESALLRTEKREIKVTRPTSTRHSWAFVEVETEFDHVAAEHNDKLESMYNNFSADLLQRGRPNESYRRWLTKLKKKWVRTVVSHGKRVDELDDLLI